MAAPIRQNTHTYAAPIRTNTQQNNNQTTKLPLRRRGTRTYPPESARAARSTAEAPWRPPSSPRALGTGHRAMLWLCFPGTWQLFKKISRDDEVYFDGHLCTSRELQIPFHMIP